MIVIQSISFKANAFLLLIFCEKNFNTYTVSYIQAHYSNKTRKKFEICCKKGPFHKERETIKVGGVVRSELGQVYQLHAFHTRN